MITYREKCPDSLTNGVGIISTLSNLPDIPWNIFTQDEIADVERTYNFRSGFKKLVSTLNDISLETISNIISTMYSQSWTKIWNDYQLEYGTIDGYVLQETYQGTISKVGDNTDTFGKVVERNGTDTGTVQTTSSDNGQSTDNIFGFNSTMAVPANSGNETMNSTGNETRDLETTDRVTNSGNDSSHLESNEETDFTRNRKGNIGYHTPQKMISENIALWKNSFFEIVFTDIDRFITISIY